MKNKLLDFIRKQAKPLTVLHLSHLLKAPPEAINKEVFDLKMMGAVQELTLEQLLKLEK